jgi:broad specificity phosphatase PhoE
VPLVALVRHGQASFGAADYDALSGTGRRQAAIAGIEITRRGLRDPELVSGTLTRQRDTAAILAEAAGITAPRVEDARWNEYDHEALVARRSGVDAASGVDSRTFQVLLDGALAAWAADTGDGGWARFTDGAVAALRELAGRLPAGRDAVVVTSGGVLGALAAALLDAPAATAIALNRVAVNGAITTVGVGRRGLSLLSFNDHAHVLGGDPGLLTYR